MTVITKDNITGLILSGGQGRRLGKVNKSFLSYKNQLLFERQLNWFEDQVSSIIVSANQNIEQYKNYNILVLTDSNKNYLGPMQGVYAALLKAIETDWLFVQPIDVPNLPTNTIQIMLDKINADNNLCSNAFYLKTQTREHYLSMLIHRSLLNDLEVFIHSEQKKVKYFLQKVHAVSLDLGFSESEFKNLNTLDDFKD